MANTNGHPTGLSIKTDLEASELRQISLDQIRYMEEILSGILTYSSPDTVRPDWITIDKVLEMAISLSQRKLDAAGVTIETHYQSGIPTIYGDATKLRQAFTNLISNAANATEGVASPRIDIEVMLALGAKGTSIRVEIRDNGCGLKPNEQEKLFEPFYTTRSKGTGLGLAIVKRILNQHQAHISIEPNTSGGVCAVVSLPVTPLQEERNPPHEVMEVTP